MSETVPPPVVSESAADASGSPLWDLPLIDMQASFQERTQLVLQFSLDAFARCPDWVIFFRDILGVGGLIHRAFADEEFASFQRGEEYARIQEMLKDLRVRPKPKDQEVEPTRVITVRLPQTLHEALKSEAHKRATSVNQLCISKLVQLIDEKLVQKD